MKFKRTVFKIEILVFTVTFDQINASFLNNMLMTLDFLMVVHLY